MGCLVWRYLRGGLVLLLTAPVSLTCAADPHTAHRVEAHRDLSLGATCHQGLDPFIVVLAGSRTTGGAHRMVVVSEKPIGEVDLRIGGAPATYTRRDLLQGPPYAIEINGHSLSRRDFAFVELFDKEGKCIACAEPSGDLRAPRPVPDTGVWTLRRSWNPAWERFYSAWVAMLFRSTKKGLKGWKTFEKVLYKKKSNLLYDFLGLGEDDPRNDSHVRAVADCGDMPYQLRAYFSWKLGLPFRFRHCTRGNARTGPMCRSSSDNRSAAFDRVKDPVARFNAFIKQGIAWRVHSGTMRTLPDDEGSDFYPIALTRDSIRPGTVFVDVGGHALVVASFDENGLIAVDGHPDKTVTRKSFDKRHFPYAKGLKTGGFKAFRPLRMRDGNLEPLTNDALTRFFSTEQYEFKNRKSFYNRMNRLIADIALQ